MEDRDSRSGVAAGAGIVVEVSVDPGGWDPVVAAVDGAQIVVGGPGTGKTEFLVRRAAHLVGQGVPADAIVVVAFGRRGVADLDGRIAAATPADAPPVAVTTFHALAAGVVESRFADRGWRRPPQILTGPEQSALVRELLAGEDPRRWSPAMRPLLRTTTFAGEVTDFLLRASEQLLDAGVVAAIDRADWRGMAGFMGRYRQRLLAAGRIDYGMVLAEAASILRQHPLDASHVLVDEYQDTTASQVALLQALAGEGNITAAADPHQSIYGFRGASVENVARFGDTFARPGSPARRIVLTTSFRTPEAILEAAERIVGDDIPGTPGPVVPASGGGRVDLHRFHQQTAEAEWIAAEILRLHLVDGLSYGALAVFVRSKRRFVAELSRALERRGIPHEPPVSRTIDQPEVRFVLDLVAAATMPESPARTRFVRHILLGPWFGLTLGVLRDLERVHRAAASSWADTLRPRFPELAALLVDPSWATDQGAAMGAWTVWSSLPQLAAIATGPEQRTARAAWASLLQVLTRWTDRNPASSLVDYARLLEDEAFEARPLLSYAVPADARVTITTLHQAKGLEFAVVFIADAVEGVFPDLRVQDTLLGVRHLLPDVPHDAAGYRRFRLQEERRLAYTAMTRASHRVVWTATATGFEEGRGIPSRFLALAAGTDTVQAAVSAPMNDGRPVTVSEAEGLLRRLAADPEARWNTWGGRPLRLAAMAVLADGSRWGMRPVSRFAGFNRRGPDTGVVTGSLRLSPSQGEQYERCPRRYALERRLAIGASASYHADLGTLVHDVLEAVERRAIEAGAARSTAQEAVAELQRRYDGAVFGGEPYATAWRQRAVAILEQLYGKWPPEGRPVLLEHRLEMAIDGADWLGYADRIEQRAGGLAIVDYKTGSGDPTIAGAAESLQLGYYMLAARADREVTDHGPVTAAEMWLPWAGRHQKQLMRRSFDPANLPAVFARLKAVAAGVAGEDWTPRPGGHCERCPVRTVCPAQPDGAEGFVA